MRIHMYIYIYEWVDTQKYLYRGEIEGPSLAARAALARTHLWVRERVLNRSRRRIYIYVYIYIYSTCNGWSPRYPQRDALCGHYKNNC